MTHEQKLAELTERILACLVAGQDPKLLKEQLKKLLAEKPPEK